MIRLLLGGEREASPWHCPPASCPDHAVFLPLSLVGGLSPPRVSAPWGPLLELLLSTSPPGAPALRSWTIHPGRCVSAQAGPPRTEGRPGPWKHHLPPAFRDHRALPCPGTCSSRTPTADRPEVWRLWAQKPQWTPRSKGSIQGLL